jgi:hypothetical protein
MNRVIRTPDGRLVQLWPVRLYRLTPPGAQTPVQMTTPHAAGANSSSQPAPTAAEQPTRHPALQPIPSGQACRVTSPPEHSLVTPPLASALRQVFEQFAQANGFSAEQPLSIAFGRGTLGLHRFGRAADIYAVGEKGLSQWAYDWNSAMRQAATTPQERARLVAEEQARNLGYKLYKALQAHGGWAQPPGYPVQLFGPWTRGEGPHKTISDQMLQAHRDHIHVAK